MDTFFAELKRRNIYRMAAAYIVVAWLIVQVVSNLAPILELPAWIGRAVLLFLALGFPIAMLLAWMFEGNVADPRTARIHAHGQAADWILSGALATVIGIFIYQQAGLAPERPGVQEASVTGASPNGAISIVVLPFANMSGDAGQEFFSDGMTEEINAALAKVTDLHVIARTSAFQFKDQNQDVRSVGHALGASHLIEGSVRKAGDRVRITAQLVRAGDGVQLWSESYDRELNNIFATQEDIAQAIAGALRVPLGLQQGERLVPNRTQDIDSYQQYLLARSLIRARTIDKAMAILEPMVARDPSYAPASALLAYA